MASQDAPVSLGYLRVSLASDVAAISDVGDKWKKGESSDRVCIRPHFWLEAAGRTGLRDKPVSAR
jgi:hypothetical protein